MLLITVSTARALTVTVLECRLPPSSAWDTSWNPRNPTCYPQHMRRIDTLFWSELGSASVASLDATTLSQTTREGKAFCREECVAEMHTILSNPLIC